MRTLDELTLEDFSPHLNDEFTIEENGQKIVLKLIEAKPLGNKASVSKRDPFCLTFAGDPRLRGPQRIYSLQHPNLGILEIFLVPLQPDATVSRFEAVFT
jgi:hypothetical protein